MSVKKKSPFSFFRGTLAAWVVLAISFSATLAAWFYVRGLAERRATDYCVLSASALEKDLKDHMLLIERLLRSGAALFYSSQEVTAPEWRSYLETMAPAYESTGIYGAGFVKTLSPAEKEPFIRKMTRWSPSFGIRPAGERKVYMPVAYMEPSEDFNFLPGYDLYADPVHRGAIDHAISSKAASMTPRTSLRPGDDADLVIYFPVFHKEDRDRTRPPDGLVFVTVGIHRFFSHVLGGRYADFNIKVSDGSPESLIFDSGGMETFNSPKGAVHFAQRRTIYLYGRSWTISFTTKPSFQPIQRETPSIVLAAGSVVSLLFFLMALTQIRHRERAQAMNREMEESMAFRLRVEKALKESERKYKGLLELAHEGIWALDKAGRTVFVNPSMAEMLGCTQGEMREKSIYDFLDDASSRTVEENFTLRKRSGFEVEFKRANSGKLYALVEMAPLSDEEGEYGGTIIGVMDITSRKRMEEELERLAATDTLTGAYNRQKFNEIISIETERLNRYGHPLSLIMYDLDNFKAVNDTYGHKAGDEVLKAISGIVRENMRELDFLFRWGGEEFIILVPEVDVEGAFMQAERIRKILEGHRFDSTGPVTGSFGVSEYKSGDTVDSFIERADAALYRAKALGRNRVERGI